MVEVVVQDELPVEILMDTAPGEAWCSTGAAPDGFSFMGAVLTALGWLLPCPCACKGWTLLRPDGPASYRLVHEARCSRGCAAEDIIWQHQWQNGSLPIEPVRTDALTRRYGMGVARGEIGRLLEGPPPDPLQGLRRVAYRLGQFLDPCGLSPAELAAELLKAAWKLGLEWDEVKRTLADALSAGKAQPARVPRS